MQIFKDFTFDAAHFLPNVPEGHKCKEMHGHTYLLTVYIEGEPDEELGWLMDFSDLKSKINPIINAVDHKLLNQIEGLENPTCERIAIWLWEKIKAQIPQLTKVKLKETPTSGVVYCGQ